MPGAVGQDEKLKQYLEDERIALFLQNEEFMRELQRNRDFLMALEKGRGSAGVHVDVERRASWSNHGRLGRFSVGDFFSAPNRQSEKTTEVEHPEVLQFRQV